jgi:hypothetical protein
VKNKINRALHRDELGDVMTDEAEPLFGPQMIQISLISGH